jgi:hypothetical protein
MSTILNFSTLRGYLMQKEKKTPEPSLPLSWIRGRVKMNRLPPPIQRQLNRLRESGQSFNKKIL